MRKEQCSCCRQRLHKSWICPFLRLLRWWTEWLCDLSMIAFVWFSLSTQTWMKTHAKRSWKRWALSFGVGFFSVPLPRCCQFIYRNLRWERISRLPQITKQQCKTFLDLEIKWPLERTAQSEGIAPWQTCWSSCVLWRAPLKSPGNLLFFRRFWQATRTTGGSCLRILGF